MSARISFSKYTPHGFRRCKLSIHWRLSTCALSSWQRARVWGMSSGASFALVCVLYVPTPVHAPNRAFVFLTCDCCIAKLWCQAIPLLSSGVYRGQDKRDSRSYSTAADFSKPVNFVAVPWTGKLGAAVDRKGESTDHCEVVRYIHSPSPDEQHTEAHTFLAQLVQGAAHAITASHWYVLLAYMPRAAYRCVSEITSRPFKHTECCDIASL